MNIKACILVFLIGSMEINLLYSLDTDIDLGHVSKSNFQESKIDKIKSLISDNKFKILLSIIIATAVSTGGILTYKKIRRNKKTEKDNNPNITVVAPSSSKVEPQAPMVIVKSVANPKELKQVRSDILQKYTESADPLETFKTYFSQVKDKDAEVEGVIVPREAFIRMIEVPMVMEMFNLQYKTKSGVLDLSPEVKDEMPDIVDKLLDLNKEQLLEKRRKIENEKVNYKENRILRKYWLSAIDAVNNLRKNEERILNPPR